MPDLTLYDFAAAFLAAAVAGIDADRRPVRQVIEPGPNFSHDKCDGIAIELKQQYAARIAQTTRSDRPLPIDERQPFKRVAVYQITLWLDCMPTFAEALGTLTAPDVASVNAASALVLSDGWQAKQGVHALLVSNDRPVCEHANVGDLVPFGPSGGEAGVRFPVTISF